MNVRELSREQLNELKSREFDLMWVDDAENISDEEIFERCDGIEFTDDDFFCTAKTKEEINKINESAKNRNRIIDKLVDMLASTEKFAFTDIDNEGKYRFYCFVEDSEGFWNQYIHMGIDNNETKEIDLIEDACDICDIEMFEAKINLMLDKFEREYMKVED